MAFWLMCLTLVLIGKSASRRPWVKPIHAVKVKFLGSGFGDMSGGVVLVGAFLLMKS